MLVGPLGDLSSSMSRVYSEGSVEVAYHNHKTTHRKRAIWGSRAHFITPAALARPDAPCLEEWLSGEQQRSVLTLSAEIHASTRITEE